jgi:glycosyltransferase involved in cell wall biosynthesis
LRVLTVGAVGLRKGSPYVLRAARALGAAAQFRMAGPAQLSPAARAEFEGHVELLGPVPRNQVRRHFEWADVFLLPSVCEGSATATYEALAAGLPVVCTHNTGSVVTDGADGFLVPARDHLPIVERMARFAEPGVLEAMSANALAKARAFDLEAYSRRALAAIAPAALAVCETAG